MPSPERTKQATARQPRTIDTVSDLDEGTLYRFPFGYVYVDGISTFEGGPSIVSYYELRRNGSYPNAWHFIRDCGRRGRADLKRRSGTTFWCTFNSLNKVDDVPDGVAAAFRTVGIVLASGDTDGPL